MRLVAIIILLACSAVHAAVTERYVSSSGSASYASSTSSGTPMSIATAIANCAANDRINIKADGTYTVTSPGLTISAAGPIFWRGYTTTIGDGGRATIDGGTSGASYEILTVSGANHTFQDLIFANNGATGSAIGVEVTGQECVFIRCLFHDMRGYGVYFNFSISALIECESYDCNQSNTAGGPAGLGVNLSGSVAIRCHSHDHTAGANAHGLQQDGGVLYYRCISESNTGNGLFSTGDTTSTILYTDFWNNTQSGIYFTNPSDMLTTMANCNFADNGRWAFEYQNTDASLGTFLNNGFGSGTAANGLGDIELTQGVQIIGSVTYSANSTPWTDPANGDFRITLAGAKGAGRGEFVQTAASYDGTSSTPDIGSAQHAE